jgi:hypothetical protein
MRWGGNVATSELRNALTKCPSENLNKRFHLEKLYADRKISLQL